MSETTETTETQSETTDESTETTETTETESAPEGSEALGDAGKKALDSMKARWKAERDNRRKLEEELESLRTPKPTDNTDQPDAAEIKRQATRDANAKANARIIRSEIKAAAAGKLADPSDALAYLDPTAFELDANGDVDAEELSDAISELLTRKPYLAATGRPTFQGTGDGGAARKASGPSQLSRSDLAGMSAAQIDAARKAGRLSNLLSGI